MQDNTVTGGVLPTGQFNGTSAIVNQNDGVVPDDGIVGTGSRFLADNGT
jgi:hypothetical protein